MVRVTEFTFGDREKKSYSYLLAVTRVLRNPISKKQRPSGINTKKTNMDTSKFDIAEYLDDEEMVQEYLNTVLEEGNAQEIIVALGHVAKAIGMSRIAEQTGLSRPSLYKALSPDSKPQFETILKVIRAIGENFQLKASL